MLLSGRLYESVHVTAFYLELAQNGVCYTDRVDALNSCSVSVGKGTDL